MVESNLIGDAVKYSIVSAFGKESGFGDAFKVKRVSDGKIFIAKVNRNLDRYQDAVDEAMRLKKYSHKNIVRYIDSFSHGDALTKAFVIVMEFCDGKQILVLTSAGGDLSDYIKSHGGKQENFLRYMEYFEQMAEGLHEIHSKKDLHRDVKPDNVFMLKEGDALVPKLGDLGLARDAKSRSMASSYSKGVGSDYYKAPEALKGEAYGQSNDVWALGVMFYEMLTGTHPFDTVDKILNAKKKSLPDWVDNETRGLVKSLLSKKHHKRMKT
jgi:NIMA (never in mitosis gene a)-related kinase